ncbi:MAG: CofH family radical SAM protein [Candidatus Lindowbacteria bacterium]|nr:CofH family radical SAM protein [Candidatus Lindowbacteria bacterium]
MTLGTIYRDEIAAFTPGDATVYSKEDLLDLVQGDLDELGRLADEARKGLVGDNVYYTVNRHIEPTNICRLACTFCSFAKHDMKTEGSFRYTVDEIIERTKGDEEEGITEYHIVGGVDAALNINYYVELIQALSREHPTMDIKALSAVEIGALAMRHRTTYADVCARFLEAGASALTGGGAEIFAPRVRNMIAPYKINGEQWIEVHEAAHSVGMYTNATILYGHFETMEERIDHILDIRTLQERTGGFRAFIPLPFNPQEGTPMENEPEPGGEEFLRTMALSRLALHNFHTIKAYWPAAGLDWGTKAIHFGANDLDGTITEETIYHTGQSGLTRMQLEDLIRSEGRNPVQR